MTIPPPPPGFTIDAAIPPPPDGFTIDQPSPSAGVGFQFAGGFNEGLSRYTEGPERVIEMGMQVLKGQRPSWDRTTAPLTTWLRSSVPAPQTGAQRFVRRVGEEFGANAPYAALSFAGAPAVAAAAEGAPAAGAVTRAVGQMARGITNTPGRAAVGEAAAVAGAGSGAAVAEQVAPGNETAEMVGQLAGGLTPAAAGYAPSVLAAKGFNFAASRLSPAAQSRAAKGVVSDVLGPEVDRAKDALRQAEEVKAAIPGYAPSLAEATGSPSLVATQRQIEGQASGADLENIMARRRENEAAVERFKGDAAPAGGGPQVVVDTLTRRVTNLKEDVASEAARIDQARRGIAATLPNTDKAAAGATLRSNLLDRRDEAKVRMAKLADDLGINDVDISAPFQTMQDDVRTLLTEGGAFADRANVPSVATDILNFGRRSDQAMRSYLREIRYGSGERPKSLLQFLRARGGLKDDGGELRARDLTKAPPGLLRPNGSSLDDAARAATEAGYIGLGKDRATVDELLKAMDQEIAGKPVFSLDDDAAVARNRDIDAFRRDLDQAGIDMNLPDDEIVRRMDFAAGSPGRVTVTFKDLMGLRSRITDDIRDAMSAATPSAKKIRVLEGLKARVDRFIDESTAAADPEIAGRLKQFRDSYRQEYIDRFNQGAAYKVRALNGRGYYQTPDERVADAFWQDVDGARQFKRTYGEDAPETEALAGVVLDDLRTAAVRDGQIVPGLHQAWLRRYDKALNEFPTLKARVSDIGSVNEGLIARATQLSRREKIIDRSMLNRELDAIARGRPPEDLIADAIQNPRLMAQIERRVRKTGADGALRRAVFETVADAPLPKMREYLAKNAPALRIALTPKHHKDLETILTATEQMARVPEPAGRAYDPNSLADVERRLGTGMNQIASRVFAANSGRTSWRYVAIDLISRFWRGHSQQETAALLKEALYNPDIARDLVDLVQLPAKREAAAKRLNSWLLQVGVDEEGTSEAGSQQSSLPPQEEAQFQSWIKALPWYREFAQQYGAPPNLNDPDYDYRAAWKAGCEPQRHPGDGKYHWPSVAPDGTMLKGKNHPTRWKEEYLQATGQDPDTTGVTEQVARQVIRSRSKRP
jgi:hypothetical protein